MELYKGTGLTLTENIQYNKLLGTVFLQPQFFLDKLLDL